MDRSDPYSSDERTDDARCDPFESVGGPAQRRQSLHPQKRFFSRQTRSLRLRYGHGPALSAVVAGPLLFVVAALATSSVTNGELWCSLVRLYTRFRARVRATYIKRRSSAWGNASGVSRTRRKTESSSPLNVLGKRSGLAASHDRPRHSRLQAPEPCERCCGRLLCPLHQDAFAARRRSKLRAQSVFR